MYAPDIRSEVIGFMLNTPLKGNDACFRTFDGLPFRLPADFEKEKHYQCGECKRVSVLEYFRDVAVP